jgi:hypothetical protein
LKKNDKAFIENDSELSDKTVAEDWSELVEREKEDSSKAVELEALNEKKKFRKGTGTALGLVTSIFGLVAILFSIFFSFEGSSVQQSSTDSRVHIDVTITASQFHSSTSNSICAGSGPIAGLSTAALTLSQSSSNLSLKSALGAGSLTQNGSCQYSVVLTPPANFSGGKVSASIAFGFGTAPATTFDLGTVRPFPRFPLTINLS